MLPYMDNFDQAGGESHARLRAATSVVTGIYLLNAWRGPASDTLDFNQPPVSPVEIKSLLLLVFVFLLSNPLAHLLRNHEAAITLCAVGTRR